MTDVQLLPCDVTEHVLALTVFLLLPCDVIEHVLAVIDVLLLPCDVQNTFCIALQTYIHLALRVALVEALGMDGQLLRDVVLQVRANGG